METKERLVGLSPAIEQAIELAIYRKNESTYEAYVKRHDAQFRILTWAVGLILALGLGIGAFFFHKDFSAFSKAAENDKPAVWRSRQRSTSNWLNRSERSSLIYRHSKRSSSHQREQSWLGCEMVMPRRPSAGSFAMARGPAPTCGANTL